MSSRSHDRPSPARDELVERLFHGALELDPARRSAFLREACGEDRALREEVAELLALAEDERDPLEHVHARTREAVAAMTGSDRFGDFELVREIGRGGMGIVHDALDARTGRRVALKVLPDDFPEALARFRREGGILSRLSHPGLVEVHLGSDGDVIQRSESGLSFFAMELVPGVPLETLVRSMVSVGFEDLDGERIRACLSANAIEEDPSARTRDLPRAATLVREGRTAIEVICGIVIQVAAALDHVHRAGLIHRDVKPSNILVCPSGRVVLTDFGLARRQGAATITRTDLFVGTTPYVSPEQAGGNGRALGHRTDIFSLGVTLYESLTLRKPFEGDTAQAVLREITEEPPSDPRALNPGVPEDLATIVLHALEKEPADRYPTAGTFAEDLWAFLHGRPIGARRPSTAVRLVRWARREPARAALAGVLALALPTIAGLGGYLIAKRPEILAAEREADRARVQVLLEDGFAALGFAGSAEAAREHFEKVLRIQPDHLEAMAGRALALLRDGEARTALEFIEGQVTAHGPSRALERIRAQALRELGETEEADRLLAMLPEPWDGLECFIEGSRLLNEGRLEDVPRGYELLDGAVRLTKEAPLHYHGELARAASRLENDGPAREIAHTLEVRWPDRAVAWLWIGLALFEHDEEHARVALEMARSLAPESASLHFGLGCVLQENGREEEAVDLFEKAVELDPSEGRAYNNLGVILLEDDEYQAAIDLFTRGIVDSSDHARLHHNLGEAHLEIKDYAAAVESYERAIALRENYPFAWNGLGAALKDVGRTARAEQALERSLELDPLYSAPYHNLDALLCAEQRFGDARRSLDRGLHFLPESSLLWNDLAWTLVDPATPAGFRDEEEGLEAAEKAVLYSGRKQANPLDTLRLAYLVNDRLEDALEVAEEALTVIHPDQGDLRASLEAFLEAHGRR